MYNKIKKISAIASLSLLLALCVILSTSPNSYAKAVSAFTIQSGYTTGTANARSTPDTSSKLVAVYAQNKKLTIYASVSGENVWGDNATWYRVSSLSSSPVYVYAALVVITTDNGDTSSSSAQGKVIVVSLSHEWMHAYLNGKEVYNAAIMSGRPALATPTGTYHVFAKLSPTTFYSPFPPSSPYWYPPTHINYALEWRYGGYFLHDSWWHSVYGPGTDKYHYDPVDGGQEGSHGCVAMPISAAAWLYNWAPIGTTVQINA